MVSRDEVIWAYRLFLGREPENEDVIEHFCSSIATVSQLREAFLTSTEHQKNHPFNLPSIQVEAYTSEELTKKMFDRVSRQWTLLGNDDPFWSVITQPEYSIENFFENSQQFYISGSHSCNVFLDALRRNKINPLNLSDCLEIGCGVGRVTKYLAQIFSNVIAVDVSKPHLDLLENYLNLEGISNVDVRHFNSVESFKYLPQVDSIYSIITLQHNPPPVITWILQCLLASLNPGGIAYFQIPTYKTDYYFESKMYLNSPYPKDLEMHFLPQYEIFKVLARHDCICLEVREDQMVGDDANVLSNSFLVQKHA